MAKPMKKCSVYSPISTVSSLLASCSLNSSNSSNSGDSIKYKDKLYTSASQALQAYIDDFELNCISHDKSISKFNLGPNSKFSRFLSKPPNGFQDFDYKRSKSSCKNQMISDIDSISLTTDDLVHFPPDGSLPIDTYIGSLHQNSKQDRKLPKKTSSENERNPSFPDPCNPVGNKDLFTPILFSDTNEKHCDDKIELLILKAKRTLEHSSEGLSSTMKNDVSPCSLDKLEAERSWENTSVTFKSPVPVDCGERPQQVIKVKRVHEFLEDCLNKDNPRSTLSGGKHHGPVEALKQMLFNLQAVQESFNRYTYAEQDEEIKQVTKDCIKMSKRLLQPFPTSLPPLHLHRISELKRI
uniref:Lung adenoma susceptibility protein 2 n=1 Tax=Vombatus ursinus TaxID=29139 RepID=A0A4X2JSZ9_VOMUR